MIYLSLVQPLPPASQHNMAILFTIGASVAAFLGFLVLQYVFKAATRSKFSAPSRISWKVGDDPIANRVRQVVIILNCFPTYFKPPLLFSQGVILNWALWPEALMKRKAPFRKITLEALQKAAKKNAKGPTDFG
jgi:hypothetical protein